MSRDAEKKESDHNEKENREYRTLIVVIILGSVIVMLAAIFGMRFAILKSTKDASAPPETSQLIFRDTFDNNDAQWFVDQTIRDFNSSGLRARTYIENGKYYREMESNDSFQPTYNVLPIPNVQVGNFCLLFDSRVFDSPQDAAIVIIVRATAWQSYYYIGFNTNGEGHVRFVDREIGQWEKGISWIDEKAHTVKISFQDNQLEIYDGQAGTLLFKTSLSATDLVSNSGDVRIGLQLFNPNQKGTAEFDNMLIYSQCP